MCHLEDDASACGKRGTETGLAAGGLGLLSQSKKGIVLQKGRSDG